MLLPLPINSPHAPSLGLLQLFLHMSVLIPPKNLPDLSLSLSLIHPPPSLLAAYSKMQEESNEWRALAWKKTPGPNQIAEMRRITVKKALSQGLGWISFCQFLQWMTSQRIQTHRGLFRKIRHLTHGFPQPSWRKQGTERIIWERSIEKPLT